MPVPFPSPNRKRAAYAPSLEGPLQAFPDCRLPRATGSLEPPPLPCRWDQILDPSNSVSSSLKWKEHVSPAHSGTGRSELPAVGQLTDRASVPRLLLEPQEGTPPQVGDFHYSRTAASRGRVGLEEWLGRSHKKERKKEKSRAKAKPTVC